MNLERGLLKAQPLSMRAYEGLDAVSRKSYSRLCRDRTSPGG